MIGIRFETVNDAKANFATIIKEAAKSKEIICQNSPDDNLENVSIISTNVLNEILSRYIFNPEIRYCGETMQHEILLHEINIYSYAPTKNQAEEELLDLVEDYVEQYLSDIERYIKHKNFKQHYPYILRLAHCDSREKMRRIIFDGDM